MNRNEIFLKKVLSRQMIPLPLRPRLNKKGQEFEKSLILGLGKVFPQFPEKPITFKLEPRVGRKDGNRLLIYHQEKTVGYVELAGYSSIFQYEVDITYNMDPKYRGVGILEFGIEQYVQYLHNHGAININDTPNEEYHRAQY